MQPQGSDSWLCYGFGYDPGADDYKIIVVAKEGGWIHSLRNMGWKPLQGFPEDYQDGSSDCWPSSQGCCFNDVLHWAVIKKRSRSRSNEVMIVAYDLHTGSFGQLLAAPAYHPEQAGWTQQTFLAAHLVELNGHLCFACDTMFEFEDVDDDKQLQDRYKFDLWLMKNDTHTTCLEKLVSIDLRTQRGLVINWKLAMPVVLHERGDGRRAVLYVCHDGRMFWCDNKANNIQVIHPATWHRELKFRKQGFDF